MAQKKLILVRPEQKKEGGRPGREKDQKTSTKRRGKAVGGFAGGTADWFASGRKTKQKVHNMDKRGDLK